MTGKKVADREECWGIDAELFYGLHALLDRLG